ncbi:YveK family protein [Anaeromicropila herbilytica]|uniref:Chain-length determining protein n=1 Tax=Anaeromicropila herbilytica TaxID=2785025 RepID=A0A7R7ENX1_9FIRM|nr:Wzz/FepE/Etk N-terminal domain-containing protein [Anaeromicropila herbilytica]BCN32262.1 chain-length determining protein [Anaeromicropila herbilytica]
MNQENDEIEIDLKELILLIRRKILIIIFTITIFGFMAFLYSKLFVTPIYSSTSEIFILTKSTSITTFADIQLGSSLTKDYMQLIKSRPVVEKVIENLDLEYKYQDMLTKLTIDNPADTRILNITIQDKNPKLAKEIADEFAVVSSNRISKIMETDAPNIVEEGTVSSIPVNISTSKITLIAVMIGAVISIAVIILIYILDDTIKTSEDIEKYLGINTLAEIPLAKGEKKSKRKFALF